MKVIKYGKPIVGSMLVTCKKCDAELEITAGDIMQYPGDRPFDSPEYCYKCPCCGRTNYLDLKDLSDEILFDMHNPPNRA